MTGRVHSPRRLLAGLGGVAHRCRATLQTAAFWLAVSLPIGYLLAFLHPAGPLATVETVSAALGLHALALVVGHSSHRDARGGGV